MSKRKKSSFKKPLAVSLALIGVICYFIFAGWLANEMIPEPCYNCSEHELAYILTSFVMNMAFILVLTVLVLGLLGFIIDGLIFICGSI